MDDSLNKIIFDKKSVSDLLKEVYRNQKTKSEQINSLIGELKPLVNDIGDATLVVPLIKEYMDLGIKNDDILIKALGIIQKIVSTNSSSETNSTLTEEEKAQLLKDIDSINKK